MAAGVYAIVHMASGKRYIGSAVDFARRWCNHRDKLRQGKHHNARLQAAWGKYGADAFEFRTLLVCSRALLLTYEQLCLDGLKPEYNLTPTAGSQLGAKRSPEFCRRNGELKRGRPLSAEHRRKISVAGLGNAYAKGRKYTPEQLERARSLRSSPEFRARLSAAVRGKKRSPLSAVCKEKLSAVARARWARWKQEGLR